MGANGSSPGGVTATTMAAIQERERPLDLCGAAAIGHNAFDDVKCIVCSNDIVVFSDSTCGYCVNAQTMLGRAGLSFVSINASPAMRQKLAMLTGSSSVPSVWVKGKFIGGCNDGPYSWMGVRKMIDNGLMNEFLK